MGGEQGELVRQKPLEKVQGDSMPPQSVAAGGEGSSSWYRVHRYVPAVQLKPFWRDFVLVPPSEKNGVGMPKGKSTKDLGKGEL